MRDRYIDIMQGRSTTASRAKIVACSSPQSTATSLQYDFHYDFFIIIIILTMVNTHPGIWLNVKKVKDDVLSSE